MSEPFNPDFAGDGSDDTEGNAWQYSWSTPQDVAGLIDLLRGDRKMVERPDQVFDAKIDPSHFADVEDISGLIGNYAHGNEPSHHMHGAPQRTHGSYRDWRTGGTGL